jgi:large subunit ribosomal protein L19
MAAEPPESTTLPPTDLPPSDGPQADAPQVEAPSAELSEAPEAPAEESTPVEAAPAARQAITGKLCARDLIAAFEAEQLKSDLPEIYVGDTVRVGVRIREGNKERIQPYEGVVIAMRHGGLNETITVRRIFQGIGVERVFLLHSPQVASVKVERRGKVRRAKLFYLRDRVGKATRVKQRFDRCRVRVLHGASDAPPFVVSSFRAWSWIFNPVMWSKFWSPRLWVGSAPGSSGSNPVVE